MNLRNVNIFQQIYLRKDQNIFLYKNKLKYL